MKQITLNIPESQEDCDSMEDCHTCAYYSRTGSYECEKIWKIGMNKMNNTESTKKIEDFPLVTTGPVKVTPLTPLPHTIFVPKLSKDGNMWCALYGENMMEGIVGFGKSPDKAINCFDCAFHEEIVEGQQLTKSPTSVVVRKASDITRFFKRA